MTQTTVGNYPGLPTKTTPQVVVSQQSNSPAGAGGMPISSLSFPPPQQVITTNADGVVEVDETPPGISSLQLATRYGHQIKSYVRPDDIDGMGVKDILLIHLKTLIDVIPIMEGELRNKPSMGTAYAFTNLLQNVRETIGEIKAVQTKDDIIAALNEQATDPILKGVLEDMSKNLSIFKDLLIPHIKDGRHDAVNELLKDLLRSLGGDLKKRQEVAYAQVQNIVSVIWG